ncbi:ketoacyl-ACP synthase III family protein [Streptomyces sp. NPDC048595]|uniref:ketoacyl-ACP synthase III family protein n=1 Tax=Streptomyces sp. NPDC048595 TaxID=3365576 RepID=UPI00370FE7E8
MGIAAAALWLPQGRSSASVAVAERRLTSRAARDLGHDSVPEALDIAPPDAAVRAATAALADAQVAAADLEVVGHAWMHYQGHDLWSPAHYVARRLGAVRALPVGIQQVCNGASAAMDLVAARLVAAGAHAQGRPRTALVTTADRFAQPGFDRWAGDYAVAYGDGATAVVLRCPAQPGDALVLRAQATFAAVELEEMHRGADAFMPAARMQRDRVDMRATKRAYLRRYGDEQFTKLNEHAIRTVVAQALEEAGWSRDDPRLRHVILPRFGRKTLTESWIPVLTDCVRATPLDVGRATGHLGAGDAVAGLAELLDGRMLAPGQAALVFSAGAGFTWSCLLVQAPQQT